jgi:hypothetical protein
MRTPSSPALPGRLCSLLVRASTMLWLGLAALPGHGAEAADRVLAPWQRIDNPPPVIGADGQSHSASCSAYPGTDATYRFCARPGRVNKLLVYFEGGGACWDSNTCTYPISARLPPSVPQYFVPSAPNFAPRATGLFDTSRADNPVRDWHMVYLPYCSADTHVGAATRTYANAGHPVYPLPSTFDIRHKGFDNFMVVLDWAARRFAAPKQVLVAGSSAGGYGAATLFPWVARQYPGATVAVLADASQGVTTAAFDAGTPGRGSWSPQVPPWVWSGDITTLSSAEILRAGAIAHPQVRVAQYSTAQDAVQVEFYRAMRDGGYGPGPGCANPTADWNRQMLGTLASYRASLPNFRSYVAPGDAHTILHSPAMYSSVAWGPPVADWLGAMLSSSGNGWADAACPDCLQPLACP